MEQALEPNLWAAAPSGCVLGGHLGHHILRSTSGAHTAHERVRRNAQLIEPNWTHCGDNGENHKLFTESRFEKMGVTGSGCPPGYFRFYALRLGWYANSVSLLQMPSVWPSWSTVDFMSCS